MVLITTPFDLGLFFHPDPDGLDRIRKYVTFDTQMKVKEVEKQVKVIPASLLD